MYISTPHKPPRVRACKKKTKKKHTFNTLTVRVVAREANRVPLLQSPKCANGEVIRENLIEIGSEKSQQEGLIWPLHEGREI